jgi:hypothetical protein
MRLIKRILTAPLVAVAVVVILFEDWLWDDLQRIAAAIGRWPVFHQAEAIVRRLPPWGALAIFAVPSLLLVPVKLAALYLITAGHSALGIATIVLAKLTGTAIVARLFTLTKPKLLMIRRFRQIYELTVRFKAHIYRVIRESAIYGVVNAARTEIVLSYRTWRSARRGWIKKRWRAIRRHQRRRSHP